VIVEGHEVAEEAPKSMGKRRSRKKRFIPAMFFFFFFLNEK
jgi:hypothetical protein